MCDSTSYDCFIGHSREHLNENVHKTMKETVYSCEGKEKKKKKNGVAMEIMTELGSQRPSLLGYTASKGIKKFYSGWIQIMFSDTNWGV